MPQLVNWSLLREPYNWIVVALMLAIAALLLQLLLKPDAGVATLTGSASGSIE